MSKLVKIDGNMDRLHLDRRLQIKDSETVDEVWKRDRKINKEVCNRIVMEDTSKARQIKGC